LFISFAGDSDSTSANDNVWVPQWSWSYTSEVDRDATYVTARWIRLPNESPSWFGRGPSVGSVRRLIKDPVRYGMPGWEGFWDLSASVRFDLAGSDGWDALLSGNQYRIAYELDDE
jgi:hypothetical protein